MTTELTQPQSEVGPDPANGQGQSQGHRRRRRRRKNKSNPAGAAQPQQPQALAPVQPQAPPQAQPQQQPAKQHKSAPPHQGGRQGSGHQNQERRKKKFFQKGSAPAPQPGNSMSVSSQGKRKGKQRGPREFVGPMDHSYRIVNGNVADGPPSTIQIMSNGRGSHFQDAFVPEPPTPVREDAPTRIFCFIDDLFFQAKIQETSRKLGVKVEFI